jgi:hypothetical protein
MTKVSISRLTFCAASAALTLFVLAPATARAGTFSFTSTSSGSGAQVSVDLDGNNCGLVNGVTTCPADSVLSTGGGTSRGFAPDSGPFTFQDVSEAVPAPGTGCSFAASSIQSCTIGSVTDGCLYNYVGGNGVSRNTSTGDLEIYTYDSGTLCINLDTGLPWSFVGQIQATITGGTGHLSNASGSFTSTFQGQILQNDPQGHGMAWVSGSSKGTLTVP